MKATNTNAHIRSNSSIKELPEYPLIYKGKTQWFAVITNMNSISICRDLFQIFSIIWGIHKQAENKNKKVLFMKNRSVIMIEKSRTAPYINIAVLTWVLPKLLIFELFTLPNFDNKL